MNLIIEQMGMLMALSVRVTTTTKHDVFCEFYPHVCGVKVSFHEGGWRAGKSGTWEQMIYIAANSMRSALSIAENICRLRRDICQSANLDIKEVV